MGACSSVSLSSSSVGVLDALKLSSFITSRPILKSEIHELSPGHCQLASFSPSSAFVLRYIHRFVVFPIHSISAVQPRFLLRCHLHKWLSKVRGQPHPNPTLLSQRPPVPHPHRLSFLPPPRLRSQHKLLFRYLHLTAPQTQVNTIAPSAQTPISALRLVK